MTAVAAHDDGAKAKDVLDRSDARWLRLQEIIRAHSSNAAKVTPVEPGRKYLAVHARQLALEPGLRILRRHPRSLSLRLEHIDMRWKIMSIGTRDGPSLVVIQGDLV